jgi:predicted MFS family arabinose efflux permease
LNGLIDGFRHVARSTRMRRVLLLVPAVAFAVSPHATLLPFMSGTVLHGGPRTLGVLLACPGFGAIGGALFLGSRFAPWRLERTVIAGSALYGCALVAFALARSFYLSIPILVVGGFGVMIFMASSNTILLSTSDESKRGRVMSLFSMSLMLSVPLGSFLAGWLASRIGAAETIAIGGAVCLASSIVFALTEPPQAEDLALSMRNEKSETWMP